jgi:hypothetical protein
MSLGDPDSDVLARVGARRKASQVKQRQPLVRRKTLGELLVEITGIQKHRDECIAAGQLRDAGELTAEVDRLTAEYGRRLSAPPVRLPL